MKINPITEMFDIYELIHAPLVESFFDQPAYE